MTNSRDEHPNNKRTVILNDSAGSNQPTRIIDQQSGAAHRPDQSGGLSPTEIVGGGGSARTPSPADPTLTSRPNQGHGYPTTEPYGGKGAAPPPGTRVLLPGSWQAEQPGSPAPPHQGATGFDQLHAASPASRADAGASNEPPVVGWLVVVAGPGRGKSRPIYWGNNSIGRDGDQHVSLDFGDTAISSKEQAFLRYNPKDRTFTLVPNLAKSNFVGINDDTPMVPTALQPFDRITLGVTTLCFVPFCGPQFDWSDA
jgi:hypothetical protein